MLESLDTIDWSSYHHAYGSAEDIPDLLRRLAVEDPLNNETSRGWNSTAFLTLAYSIFHQGDVSDAAIPTIYFLFELLEEERVKNKLDILGLLYSMARAWTSVRYKAANSEFYREFYTNEKQAFDEIVKGKGIYYRLKESDDRELSKMASLMLTLLRRVKAID